MSTTISEVSIYGTPLDRGSSTLDSLESYASPLDRATKFGSESYELIDPGETGAVERVSNRVWDTVASAFVRWSTPLIDSTGAFYPGPGVFGAETSNFVVETIEFTRI